MQAYSTAADTLGMPSDTADAQPSVLGASPSMSHLPRTTAAPTSLHSGDQSSGDSKSDPAALVGTAGDELEQDSKAVLKAGGQNEVFKLGMHGGPQQKHDEEAVRVQQEAFANATLQAFQRKLFGSSGKKDSVSVEQSVDHLIRQATSLDNLCQMYEGWTAWI